VIPGTIRAFSIPKRTAKVFGLETRDLAASQKLDTAKCARCHKLSIPTAYDEKTWSQWMDKMRVQANLNDDQYRQLAA
jgi:hypothetical protein